MRVFLRRILDPRVGDVHQLDLDTYRCRRDAFWNRDEVQLAAGLVVILILLCGGGR